MATVEARAVRVRGATARAARVTIVAARFNTDVTEALVAGAKQLLRAHGVPESHIGVVWVPGAFELPVAAACATEARPSAIVAIGCLLKGQTPQYLTIADAVAGGLTQVAVATKIPVTFGVIVADSVEQARARAGGSEGNRGRAAAAAALAMVEAIVSMRSTARRGRAGR